MEETEHIAPDAQNEPVEEVTSENTETPAEVENTTEDAEIETSEADED